MADLIDITVPLCCDMPIWPGSVGSRLTRTMRLEAGDPASSLRLECDVHVGTHVDAPRHFLKNGDTAEQLPLDLMIGPAVVAYLPEAKTIAANDLADLDLPLGTQRLLLRTCNSTLWETNVTEFKKDYVALTVDAAQWVVDHGISLIGVDYLSVQRYDDGPLTHEILLRAGIIILEGLNLAEVRPGSYEVICLPLKLTDADGAPARVILRCTEEPGEQPEATGERS